MRERLIELLGKELMDYASWQTEMALAGNYDMPSVEEVIADKILKDGWMRPPCKVGDTLWDIREFVEGEEHPEMYVLHADEITVCKNGWFVIDSCSLRHEDFGKTVFLTREEAERALEGGAE